PAIDEDRHVFAQSGLVVEHVAARLRIVRKNGFENVPYGAAGGFGLGHCHVPLDVGREDDLDHGSRSIGREIPARWNSARPRCPRLLRASASFLGLGGYTVVISRGIVL